MLIHSVILKVLLNLGYTDTPGCCHGFSIGWLEACLLDNEALFNQRIHSILEAGDGLVKPIEAVKQKKSENLTAKDKELLEILAFFDRLELYQSPYSHSSLFSAPLMQCDIEAISNFASSTAIQAAGGLAMIYSEPVIYTKTEMISYLNALGVLLEQSGTQIKKPFGIILNNYNHNISVTYTPGKGWNFMDINSYPSQFFNANQTSFLATRIMRGFQSKGPHCAFNISVVTTGNHFNLMNLKETFNHFKKTHLITKDIALREDGGTGLAFIAAQHGHVLVIAELAQHKADFNQANNKGLTPAFIAAEFGHTPVITELAKHGVDFNKASNEGKTPAFIAAENGHTLVIAELVKIGVNFNATYTESVANLRQFAMNYGDKVITKMNDFISQQLALFPNKNTVVLKPFHIAFIMGHDAIMNLLNNQTEQLQKSHNNTQQNRLAFFASVDNLSASESTQCFKYSN